MIARIAQLVFAAFLAIVGGYLAFYGFELMRLGGSWYYLVTGVGLVLSAVLLVFQNPWGPRLYALIAGATLVWALYESGLDFIALLPRVAAFVVVGLWFLTPWHRTAMHKDPEQDIDAGALPNLAAAALSLVALGVAAMQGYDVEPGTEGGEAIAALGTDWRNYGNTPGGSRFSPLQQINSGNVGGLQEVWRYRTRVPYDFKNTPLQVGDLLYVCTAGNIVIALDAATGEERWRHDTQTKVPGARNGDISTASTFARTCRGLGYYETPADWTGTCPKRIITNTVDARLIAIDALSGRPCPDFGFEGEVDLRAGMGPHLPFQYFMNSAPLIAGDKVVISAVVLDIQELGHPSGVIRAFDVLTGAFAWAWDIGKPEYRGPPDEGETYTRGTPNVWSSMSYDPELNLVYAPTGNAAPDYFGGKRREFDDKYSAATVALDADSGELRWVYQNVHHDIWDYDAPSQPVLVDITRDGKRIPAVAQPTKRGEIFLLDRRTGEPLWPATTCEDGSAAQAGGECLVPQGPVDGDYVTATQPFSALPNFRPHRHEKDMWGLTPLDQLHCRIEYKKMRYEGHFTPPMPGGGETGDTMGPNNSGEKTWGGTFQFPGNAGGFNWPSVSVDAENGILVAQPMLMGNRIFMFSEKDQEVRLARQRAVAGDSNAQAAPAPPRAPWELYTDQGLWDPDTKRYASTSPFMSTWRLPFTKVTTGVPCFEPPYGMLAAIDLNTGKLMWKRAIGTAEEMGPFGIGLRMPFQVGTPIYGGTMITRSGLIFQVGSMDSTIRAVDLRTGKIRWQDKLPGTANGTPITYLSQKDGRQYLVISVPNPGFIYPRDTGAKPSDDQGGYVIAYALPTGAP